MMHIFCNFLRNLITYYWQTFMFIHRNVFYHFSALPIIQHAAIPAHLGCFHSSALAPSSVLNIPVAYSGHVFNYLLSFQF